MQEMWSLPGLQCEREPWAPSQHRFGFLCTCWVSPTPEPAEGEKKKRIDTKKLPFKRVILPFQLQRCLTANFRWGYEKNMNELDPITYYATATKFRCIRREVEEAEWNVIWLSISQSNQVHKFCILLRGSTEHIPRPRQTPFYLRLLWPSLEV